MRRPCAAADTLIRRLLHLFGEKTLQRALTLVDQVSVRTRTCVCTPVTDAGRALACAQRGVSCVVAEATRRVLFQARSRVRGCARGGARG